MRKQSGEQRIYSIANTRGLRRPTVYVYNPKRSPASEKKLPVGGVRKKKTQQNKTGKPQLALHIWRSQTVKCFKDHNVLQSLSTDCRVLLLLLSGSPCTTTISVSRSLAPSKYSTKLAQSLCIDCGRELVSVEQPLQSGFWQAKIRFSTRTYLLSTPTAIFMHRLLIYFIQ